MNSTLRNHRPSTKVLLLILGAVLLLALGYWISRQITWKEEEIDIGYTEAARADQFLAARLFLERQDVNAQTLRSFTLLDNYRWQGQTLGKDDTLVLVNAYKMVKGERLESLLAWVESGGRVITSTQNPFIGGDTDTEDLLLDRFSLEVFRNRYEDEDEDEDEDYDYDDDEDYDGNYDDSDHGHDDAEEDADEEENYDGSDEYSDDEYSDTGDDTTEEDNQENQASDSDETELETTGEGYEPLKYTQDSAETPETEEDKKEKEKEAERVADWTSRCNTYSTPLEAKFVDETQPLLVDKSEGQAFSNSGTPPRISASDGDSLHLAGFDWGQGQVIVTGDNHIWTNRRIDCHDHAYLLWKLINPRGKVWFLVNQEAPSLWTILWRSTPYGALAALLALGLWLWAKAVRFGPVLTRASSGRRSLAEHIHASAMLLWRRQQHPYLVTLLRNELRQQLLKHYPLFDEWTRAEQITHLQTLTSLSPGALEKAFFSDQLQSPQDFTEAVAYLQMIRKSI